jgi:CspA family cold shock protein
MSQGTIKSLRDRGFGFVAPDGGNDRDDLFFHRSAVANDGFEQLREGQRVGYDQEPDPRDPSRQRAVNVSPMDDAE